MSNAVPISADLMRVWRMPVVPEDYDQTPSLSCAEQEALTIYLDAPFGKKSTKECLEATATLAKLNRPFTDVAHLRNTFTQPLGHARHVLYAEMLRRGNTFWSWSEQEWAETIGANHQEFVVRHGHPGGNTAINGKPHGERARLFDLAYLLGDATCHLWQQGLDVFLMANAIFGAELIQQEFARIAAILVGKNGEGYSDRYHALNGLQKCFNRILLLNRSPYLEL